MTSSVRLNHLLAFVELDPGDLSARKDAIREAFSTGELALARELIAAGLRAHPIEPDLLALCGVAHLRAQRYADAEQVLRAAFTLGIGESDVRHNLALALFMQKRYFDALGFLTPASQSSLAPLLRARCFQQLDRIGEAISDCRAHLACSPADAEVNGLLALLLYEQSQREAATGHAAAALKRDPKQLDALLALASMQADEHEYDAAYRSFGTLLDAHPQWHVAAWVQIMRNDIPAAEAAFGKALQLGRHASEAYGGLAVTAALQGRQDVARRHMGCALRLDSRSMTANYAEMLLLQSQGRLREAHEILERVLARPAEHRCTQYRDLMTAQMRYPRTCGQARAAVNAYH